MTDYDRSTFMRTFTNQDLEELRRISYLYQRMVSGIEAAESRGDISLEGDGALIEEVGYHAFGADVDLLENDSFVMYKIATLRGREGTGYIPVLLLDLVGSMWKRAKHEIGETSSSTD